MSAASDMVGCVRVPCIIFIRHRPAMRAECYFSSLLHALQPYRDDELFNNKKIIDLKTALLNEAGLERNRFYFCRCVVANARAIYRFSVSVSVYSLCIAWV